MDAPRPPRVMRRKATHESVRELRDFVGEYCSDAGAGDEVCYAFKLSVEEACTNIVRHGYSGDARGAISVSVRDDGERIEVTIEDDAAAFRPDAVPQPDLTRDWHDRRVGGLGWYLINEYMDEVEHTTGGDSGNRLRLAKRKGAARADAEPGAE